MTAKRSSKTKTTAKEHESDFDDADDADSKNRILL
jgi:hypothetical protein